MTIKQQLPLLLRKIIQFPVSEHRLHITTNKPYRKWRYNCLRHCQRRKVACTCVCACCLLGCWVAKFGLLDGCLYVGVVALLLALWFVHFPISYSVPILSSFLCGTYYSTSPQKRLHPPTPHTHPQTLTYTHIYIYIYSLALYERSFTLFKFE